MFVLRPSFRSPLSRGMGKSLKVETVQCGRQMLGLNSSLVALKDAETLKFISERLSERGIGDGQCFLRCNMYG